ncbi:MAG: hypothetical protein IGR76_18810, partial [Synechococcales cyanobacterium T60_A2020_003]|nr:hypothetical protein [Synechococcales cyanobacterium T60_A2020_003]
MTIYLLILILVYRRKGDMLPLTFIIIFNLLIFLSGLLLLRRFGKNAHVYTKKTGLNVAFRKTELLLSNAGILVALFLIWELSTKAVIDFDSLWFHLPAIAHWYQSASLTLLDSTGRLIFEHPDAAGYPYNWHLLSLPFVLEDIWKYGEVTIAQVNLR